jgi:hypothetical protein
MATIEREAVRATITLGGVDISTPDVVSFNVKRSRGQMCATFSATVKIDAAQMNSSMSSLGQGVVIKAGIKGRENTIFTGVVQKCSMTPLRNDASKVSLNISGKDNMYVMEGQKINRRLKTYRDGESPPARWGLITSLLEDNTPVRSGFERKQYAAEKMATTSLGKLAVVQTPDAYGTIDRSTGLPIGTISAELVTEAASQ